MSVLEGAMSCTHVSLKCSSILWGLKQWGAQDRRGHKNPDLARCFLTPSRGLPFSPHLPAMPALTWQHRFLQKAGFLLSPDFEASPHEEFIVRGSDTSNKPITVTRTRVLVEGDALSADSLTVWLVIGTWVITLGIDPRIGYSFHPGCRTAAFADVEHWRVCGGFAGASESCPRCRGHIFSGKKQTNWSPFLVRKATRRAEPRRCRLESTTSALAQVPPVKVECKPEPAPGEAGGSGQADVPLLQVSRTLSEADVACMAQGRLTRAAQEAPTGPTQTAAASDGAAAAAAGGAGAGGSMALQVRRGEARGAWRPRQV